MEGVIMAEKSFIDSARFSITKIGNTVFLDATQLNEENKVVRSVSTEIPEGAIETAEALCRGECDRSVAKTVFGLANYSI
jgi:hypothetical protein